MRNFVKIFAAILLISCLSACSHGYYPFLYHPPLSQGNVINPAAFEQLQPGMNKAEVVNMVGEPVLQTPFSPDVWHYVYTLRLKNKQVQRKEVTLYFSGDQLVRISS